MGAIAIYGTSSGMTLKEAWDNLVEDDKRENGEAYYNGTFYSCEFPREVNELIEEELEKGESQAVCIKKPVLSKAKVKTSVENFPCKSARKWITEYYATDRMGEEVAKSESQVQCIKMAREILEKKQGLSRLEIKIRKVLKDQSPKVALITLKESAKDQLGTWSFLSIAPN